MQELQTLLNENLLLILISCMGGLVLWGMKFKELIERRKQEAIYNWDNLLIMSLLFVVLPIIGGIITLVYLANGDQISPILSFQIGLTSPAILEALVTSKASSIKNDAAIETEEGQ